MAILFFFFNNLKIWCDTAAEKIYNRMDSRAFSWIVTFSIDDFTVWEASIISESFKPQTELKRIIEKGKKCARKEHNSISTSDKKKIAGSALRLSCDRRRFEVMLCLSANEFNVVIDATFIFRFHRFVQSFWNQSLSLKIRALKRHSSNWLKGKIDLMKVALCRSDYILATSTLFRLFDCFLFGRILRSAFFFFKWRICLSQTKYFVRVSVLCWF